jgi:hypothetical protein
MLCNGIRSPLGNAEVKDVDALTVIPPVGTRSGRVLVEIRG